MESGDLQPPDQELVEGPLALRATYRILRRSARTAAVVASGERRAVLTGSAPVAVLLREITALADVAPSLTDTEVTDRLVALAGRVR